MLISEIQEHRNTPEAIPKERRHITRKNDTLTKVRTTTGLELYVIWKDGSGNWVYLKDLKDSYPIELAEYAVNNKIQDEPAFS